MRKLFEFNGGVKPASHKTDSTRAPIADVPMPALFVVPLHQNIGGTPVPLVNTGDKVLKGQRIGGPDGNVSAAIHAPSSGTVIAIEPRQMAHTSGLSTLSVVIEPDGKDQWGECTAINWRAMPPDEIRDALRDAGVVGLGGAVFPSHLKLKAGSTTATRTLILNGAECEPFISCDDMLMRERSADILAGALIMRHMLQATEILIGIEDNKPEAIAAMRAAVADCAKKLGDCKAEVIAIPTRYPAGGAKQLIRSLTGIEVPQGERSTDYGVQCFNVGTTLAVHEAIDLGRPLIERVVTVAGNVAQARNYRVRFGTPMNHLVAQASAQADTDHYIMGGPMMGYRMPAFDVPVVKATNCIIAASPKLFPPPPPEMPCIRCGDCARACPADLQPFELYWHARAKNFGKAQEYNLFDCIECGACSYVCPSSIPLVDYYRFAKSEIWSREREKEAADTARVRFESRNDRIEREKSEKAARLAARSAAKPAAAPTPTGDTPAAAAPTAAPAADDAKKALIAAALARAQAQKEQTSARNTADLSPAQQAQIDEAEARRKAASSEPTPPQHPSTTAPTSDKADNTNNTATASPPPSSNT